MDLVIWAGVIAVLLFAKNLLVLEMVFTGTLFYIIYRAVYLMETMEMLEKIGKKKNITFFNERTAKKVAVVFYSISILLLTALFITRVISLGA